MSLIVDMKTSTWNLFFCNNETNHRYFVKICTKHWIELEKHQILPLSWSPPSTCNCTINTTPTNLLAFFFPQINAHLFFQNLLSAPSNNNHLPISSSPVPFTSPWYSLWFYSTIKICLKKKRSNKYHPIHPLACL